MMSPGKVKYPAHRAGYSRYVFHEEEINAEW